MPIYRVGAGVYAVQVIGRQASGGIVNTAGYTANNGQSFGPRFGVLPRTGYAALYRQYVFEGDSSAVAPEVTGAALGYWASSLSITYSSGSGSPFPTVGESVTFDIFDDQRTGTLVQVLSGSSTSGSILIAVTTSDPLIGGTVSRTSGGWSATIDSYAEVTKEVFGGTWATASGTVTPGVTDHPGTITSNWGGLTATSSATHEVPATATGDFGGLTATASATVEHPASTSDNWGDLTATASAIVEHPATIDTNWSGFVATATGTVEHYAQIASDWGGLTATAVADNVVAPDSPASLGPIALPPMPPRRAHRNDDDEVLLLLTL